MTGSYLFVFYIVRDFKEEDASKISILYGFVWLKTVLLTFCVFLIVWISLIFFKKSFPSEKKKKSFFIPARHNTV